MSEVLIVSKSGDGYPLATKLAREGHTVDFYVKDPEAKNTGKGSTNPRTVPKLLPSSRPNLTLFDMVGLGHTATKMAKGGGVVLGGGILNDTLELDREYSQKVAKLTNMKVPDYKVFSSIQEGVNFLLQEQDPYVFKPLGNQSTAWTFVAKDTNEGLISFLENLPKQRLPFILQKKINGIELSTEGWFNGKQWVSPFNHTVEWKRLTEGDKGVQTGCMGNVVWVCGEDKLVKNSLVPLTEFLTKAHYIGPLDVNCMLTSEEVYFLEFTARFGYDALQALCELLKGDLYDFLYGVATGVLQKQVFSSKYAIAVRLLMQPYSKTENIQDLQGLRVLNIPDQAQEHVWLSDVMYVKNIPVLSGTDGVVGCVTAWGEDPREARRRVYRTIENITLTQDLQYRGDIGKDFENKLDQLKEWGWIE